VRGWPRRGAGARLGSLARTWFAREAQRPSRTHVGFLEQGRREPSLSTLLILADALGVPVERLTQGLAVPRERRAPRARGRRP
jgi:transcriptional regulator with XRE-family HTH domain